MKTSSAELKKRAKQTMKGRYGLCIGAWALQFALIVVIALICIGLLGTSLVEKADPFGMGQRNDTQVFQSNILMSVVVMFLFYVIVLSVIYLFSMGIKKIFMNMSLGLPAGFSDMIFAFVNKPQRFLGLYFCICLINLVISLPYWIVYAAASITDFIPVLTVLSVVLYVLWIGLALFVSLHFSQSMMILLDDPDKKVFQCLRESKEMINGNKGRLFYLWISFIGMIFLIYGTLGVAVLWVMPYIDCTLMHFYLDLRERRLNLPYQGIESVEN